MKAKKSLGQNFLINTEILSNIVNLGDISNDDVILEIGPGTGNLTKKILEKKPKDLIVIEKDNKLASILKNKYGDHLNIINKDILDCFDDLKFDQPLKIYGNLPYNISTKILLSFLKINNLKSFCKKFIFIFQKEVADRILAKGDSKNYGRLSILSSWKMTPQKVMDISPKFFSPKPKVWSSLITLTPNIKFEQLKKEKSLEHITNIFFNQRRKMIKKPMKQLFDNYEEIATKLNIDLNIRPQNLSTKEYLEICKFYEKLI